MAFQASNEVLCWIFAGICLETNKLDDVCGRFHGRCDILFSLSTRSNCIIPQPRFVQSQSIFFLHNYYNEQGYNLRNILHSKFYDLFSNDYSSVIMRLIKRTLFKEKPYGAVFLKFEKHFQKSCFLPIDQYPILISLAKQLIFGKKDSDGVLFCCKKNKAKRFKFRPRTPNFANPPPSVFNFEEIFTNCKIYNHNRFDQDPTNVWQ